MNYTEQYIIYKRLRNEWEALGNKKLVRYFNKKMRAIRESQFGIYGNLALEHVAQDVFEQNMKDAQEMDKYAKDN
jgi:hypothetical protein